MDRIEKLVEESRSGPELYMNMGDQMVTLGTLACLLDEIYNAVHGALMTVERLEDRLCTADTVDCANFLMARLALEYAVDCHTSLIVSKDTRGLNIYADQDNPSKITFVDPTEIVKARIRAEKAQKERAGHEQKK